MDEGSAALLAGLFAAVAALIAAIIGGVVAIRNETKRRLAEHLDNVVQELRQRAADVFVQMFALQHELEWITWHAKHDPSAIDKEMVANYSSNVHATFPKLLGAMAVVRSLSRRVYDDLYLLTDHLYELDGRVAKILVRLKDQARGAEALADLASLEETCLTLYATLPHKMAEAMEAAGLYQWETLREKSPGPRSHPS